MKNKLFKISLITVTMTLAMFIFVVKAQNTNNVPNTPNEISQTDISKSPDINGDLSSGPSNDQGFGENHNWNKNNFIKSNTMMNILPSFAMGILSLGIVFSLIAILLFAFWVWMLVHLIIHDVEYKPVWVLVLWFTNIVGAVIYYFAIKRTKDCYCCAPCLGCDEECTCGDEIIEEKVEAKTE